MVIYTKQLEKANKNQDNQMQCTQLKGIIYLLKNLQKDLDFIQDLQNQEIVKSQDNYNSQLSSDQETILKTSKQIKKYNVLFDNLKPKNKTIPNQERMKNLKEKKIIRKRKQGKK